MITEEELTDSEKSSNDVDQDPLAESDDSSSEFSNDDDINDVYNTLYNLSDQSFDETTSSSGDDEPPPKRKKIILKKSCRSYKWRKVAADPVAYARVRSQDHPSTSTFDEESGRSTEAVDIFTKFFTESFMSLIVKLTNLRATSCSVELNLTESELKAFIGIIVIMGFHRLPGLHYYWKANANFAVPRVSSVMTYSRFSSILRFLSFHETSVTKKTEDFHSVRLLVDHLNEKFTDMMSFPEWLHLNESIVHSRTRKSLDNRGYENKFRVIALCCAKSGYLFQLNLQKHESDSSINDDIVRHLVSTIKVGSTIVSGRGYTNFLLAEELYSRDIFICGQISKRDPNIPSKFKTGNVRCGDFVQSGDFSVTAWSDERAKTALILSTKHNPSKKKSVLKRNELVDYPLPVADFYEYSRGAKLFDLMRLRNNTYWRSRKMATRFFYYIIDATIVNSYLVYKKSFEKVKKESSKDLVSTVDFRSNLADGLIAGFVGRKRPAPNPQNMKGKSKKINSSKTTSVANALRVSDVGGHMPTKSNSRRCAYCSTKSRPKRTTIMCTACQVGLCLMCFAPFHEMPAE